MLLVNESIDKADIGKVAELHREYLDSGFLSSLGEGFLSLLYETIRESSHGNLIIYKEKNSVEGFVSGTTDIGRLYTDFFKKNLVKGIIQILPYLLSLRIIKKIFETLFYPVKKIKEIPRAELLSIVVDKRCRGKGISERLYSALVEEFKKRDVKNFKIVVGAGLASAIQFYDRMGAQRFHELEVHKGEKSWIYIQDVL